MNILLIHGGWSSEREVALAGGKVVRAALERLGHTVTPFDPAHSLDELIVAALEKDFAFIMLHGSPGEDGLIQAMLERIGVPYQGAGPAGSLLALNKSVAKMFFANAGLPTAPWGLLSARPGPGWEPPFPFPIFIKANTGGSSLHMERVSCREDVPAAVERLFSVGDSYIVEAAVTGMEVTCGVLGVLEGDEERPVPLPPILIKARAASGIFDYTSKYSPGGAEEICPAPLPEVLTRRVQEIALAAHTLLGLEGYSRSDFIIPPEGEPIILEVNTLPGMTSTSLIPQAAAAVGLSFDALIERLLQLGMARHKRACPRKGAHGPDVVGFSGGAQRGGRV